MRIYKFWKSKEFEIMIDGALTTIVCKGASNDSLEDAAKACAEKAKRIQLIVDGKISRDLDYEKPIREEIVEKIDEHNIVTRNRYGALVLNTTAVNIFDIDEYRRSFWEVITFKQVQNSKKAILGHLKKLYEQRVLPRTSWRVYETAKGIRLIVLGDYINPDSRLFKKFARQINADKLYARLCVQQDCYRARLTPKPHRIGIKRIKFECPAPAQDAEKYQNWLQKYEAKSQLFSVCRLLETFGNSLSDNQIVEYHDRYCCNYTETLA